MIKITIDGKEIESRPGIPVLQAALEAGWDVPHYCYHPSLKVVASCRLCLMEMQMPDPKTREMAWSPKLVPSCQTPVKDGLVCRFDSDAVRNNQADCMEFFLLNHPLDCPVCDQAGECYLQDYSFKFGHPTSRMVDQKLVNPKKDIGPRTLLYQDRCVMCTRCVRFTQEIAGSGELCVVNRGSRAEIDVFPGLPLDNPLQGNVVDICPVGCLLDKDFLFKQRVWFLGSADSICPGCARGCAITVDHNEGVVHRLKPRHNPKVNDYWMCDEGRFGFKYIHDGRRIAAPQVRRGLGASEPAWEDIPEILRFRLKEHVERHGSAGVVAMLSPFLACEEAWLIARFIREYAPDAALAMGPVPMEGEDQHFPVGAGGDAVRFTILKEKAPNRRGVELVLRYAGGTTLSWEEFLAKAASGSFTAMWVSGGYPKAWVDKKLAEAFGKAKFTVLHDLFPSELTEPASIVLPACSWAEREGSFMNHMGLIQPFARAIDPPDGARRDGQWLYETAGFGGMYRSAKVRELMAATMPELADVYEAPDKPAHAH